MIVESLASRMAKNFHFCVGLALKEILKDIFKTISKKEKAFTQRGEERHAELHREERFVIIKNYTSFFSVYSPRSGQCSLLPLCKCFLIFFALDWVRNNTKLNGFYEAQRSKIPMQRLVKRIELY